MAANFLDASLTTAAFCWRLQRRDGVCLGFTTHDRDLLIDGLIYRAAPGLVPSAISATDGFETDRLDINGALTSDAINEEDLGAGRWDGAAVSLFAVDWRRPGEARLPLAQGELGGVSMKGRGFEAELRGLAALLDRPVVEQTSPECRAELGDRRCRVDIAGRIRVTRIVAVPSDDRLEVADAADGVNAHGYGRVRWLGGRNAGLAYDVRSSSGAVLRLREPPFAPAAIGDLIEIAEGCDKSFETCTRRFGNGLNFRGEPHLPGMDLLTRYPGA